MALFAITGPEAIAVVASAALVYVVFLALVRVFGTRVIGQFSTFDVLITIMLGAVAGRVILMEVPVLPAGVLGLGTLFLLEALIGELRRTRRGERLVNHRAIVVVAHGRLLERNLARAHLTVEEVHSAVRLAGCGALEEVSGAIFEANGRISVLRRGVALDPAILAGVIDAHVLTGSASESP